MEIVMQWLDDLDDLVYAGALTSERTRRNVLATGLLASLTSAAAEPAATLVWLPLTLVGVALVAVGVWSAGALAALAVQVSTRSPA